MAWEVPLVEDHARRRERLEAFAAFDDARLLQSYRLATLILRDGDAAEDATQEAIARAWSCWGSLRDTERFDAWFERILVNVCRNQLRRKRKVRFVDLEGAAAQPAADSDPAGLVRLALSSAFEGLTADQRTVVVLRYWRDLSIDEIAERMDIPAGTVKSRLHYALESLRQAMTSQEATK